MCVFSRGGQIATTALVLFINNFHMLTLTTTAFAPLPTVVTHGSSSFTSSTTTTTTTTTTITREGLPGGGVGCGSSLLHVLFAQSTPSDDNLKKHQDGKTNKEKIRSQKKKKLTKQMGRSLFLSTGLAALTNLGLAHAAPPGFQRIPTQFLAALGDPTSSSGNNADQWGIWTVDPGPRGVFLRDYEKVLAKSSANNNHKAPAGWTFDDKDWWLEEHGLIMEAPSFPLQSGRYLVTGGRLVTTVLTVGEKGEWNLEKGNLLDVTHMPCRSARYTPNGGGGSPLTAKQSDFPVTPGAEMPNVEGCDKLDYAVLFVIGKEVV